MSKRRPKQKDLLTLELGFADRPKLLKFPWPWADGSVTELKCTDVFPYVPAGKRAAFMEEIYRVLADAGKATILTNYWAGAMAYADPRAEWPPICEQTYLFFNRKWREDQKVAYETSADFDFTYGYLLAPDTAARSQEAQAFHVKSYLNTVQKLQVVLTKAKALPPGA